MHKALRRLDTCIYRSRLSRLAAIRASRRRSSETAPRNVKPCPKEGLLSTEAETKTCSSSQALSTPRVRHTRRSSCKPNVSASGWQAWQASKRGLPKLSPILHPRHHAAHAFARSIARLEAALISTISHATRVVPQRVRYSTLSIIATLLTTTA